MLTLTAIHHVAVICSNYEISKRFYTEVLGLSIVAEHYRKERKSWKLDLSLNGKYVIELFSFQNAPERISRPEARGLRHLAFQVTDLNEAINHLRVHGVEAEPIRLDEFTGKRFTFFSDPDNLPMEFYEQ
jgi:glyoxylase I family protein